MDNTLLDPKNDFVFKKLFTGAPELLADLINTVRPNQAPFEVIEIRNPHIDPDELTRKFIVLDVVASDCQQRLFNIEIQIRCQTTWIECSFYYLASAYVRQLKGKNNGILKPIIGISLLDFDLFASDRAHWLFRLQDEIHRDLTLGHLELHVLELGKIERVHQKGPLSNWVTWLRHWRDRSLIETIQHRPIHHAHAKLQALSREEETWQKAQFRQHFLFGDSSYLKESASDKRAISKPSSPGNCAVAEDNDRVNLITRLLTLKFGDPPVEFQQRLCRAGKDELDRLAERLLFAQTPSDVFD